jgi:hypothetical protein
MATRFYLQDTTTSQVNPAFGGGWEQTGQATRRRLYRKLLSPVATTLANSQVTVPITTTQDILNRQYVSEPLRRQVISGTFSMVIRCFENANSNNATLAVVVKLVSQDGSVVRGTLYSNFNADTEFPLSGSTATRIINAGSLTQTTAEEGDRIVVEIGVHAAAPSASGSANQRFGNSAASDFALTSALTTDLNPWVEFSQDFWPEVPNNYKSLKGESAGYFSDRIR